MYFKDVITLNTEVITINEYGHTVKSLTTRNVFADKMSIGQNEFYQAQATNLRPDIKFMMRSIDYNSELSFAYNGVNYNVLRTYSKDDEFIEVTGQSLASKQ